MSYEAKNTEDIQSDNDIVTQSFKGNYETDRYSNTPGKTAL